MFAIIAALLFALALILRLLSVHAGIVLDLIIGGYIGLALHLALGWGWRRP